MTAGIATGNSGEHSAGSRSTGAAGIGPNAIIQLGAAIESLHGGRCQRALYAKAGLLEYLGSPPAALVDEAEVIRLHRLARSRFGDDAYRESAELAGRLTGDYLLAHRIPRPIRMILPKIPARLALRILTRAIERNAWTFVGSGRFSVRRDGRLPELVIANSPLARGLSLPDSACSYYAATFERLYRSLVDPGIELREYRCRASGGGDCRFAFGPPATRRVQQQRSVSGECH